MPVFILISSNISVNKHFHHHTTHLEKHWRSGAKLQNNYRSTNIIYFYLTTGNTHLFTLLWKRYINWYSIESYTFHLTPEQGNSFLGCIKRFSCKIWLWRELSSSNTWYCRVLRVWGANHFLTNIGELNIILFHYSKHIFEHVIT